MTTSQIRSAFSGALRRACGAWLPPERLKNSRGRGQYRETAERAAGGGRREERSHTSNRAVWARALSVSPTVFGQEVAFLRRGGARARPEVVPDGEGERRAGAGLSLIVRPGVRRKEKPPWVSTGHLLRGIQREGGRGAREEGLAGSSVEKGKRAGAEGGPGPGSCREGRRSGSARGTVPRSPDGGGPRPVEGVRRRTADGAPPRRQAPLNLDAASPSCASFPGRVHRVR